MPLFRSKKKAAAEAEAAAAAAAEGEGGKKKKLTRAQKEKLEKEVRRAPQRPQRFACACVPRTCSQANEPRLRPRQMRANLPERQKVSRRGVFEISGPLQVSRATALPPAAALRGRV